MPTSDTAAALESAAAGLTYPSETDAPWKAFAWPDAAGMPTGQEVRRRDPHKKAGRIDEQSLDALFAPLIQDQSWYGEVENAGAAKNRAFLDVVRRLLTNPTVYRIGERKVTIYIVGQAHEGGWAGLKTTSVET
jgi:hypothetical protein